MTGDVPAERADAIGTDPDDDIDLAAVSMAWSGGGSRASMFGLGAIEALVDTGLHRSLVSVSSVSGGSIANGALAHRVDLVASPPDEIVAAIDDLERRFALDGLLLGGARATSSYIRALIAAIALSIAALVAAMAALYLDAYVATATAVVVAFVGGVAAVVLFSRRSAVAAGAIDRVLLGDRDQRIDAPDLAGRAVHHVICTTELQSGRAFYLTNRGTYGWLHGGATSPSTIPFARALQASAAVPGAFGPVRVSVSELGLDRRTVGADGPASSTVVLLDGGVYSNMADEWEVGFAGRAQRWPDLAAIQPRAGSFVLIVNGSGAWRALKPIDSGWFGTEIAGLTRSQGVQYDVSTSQRRRMLLLRFQDRSDPLEGVFVQIDASPFEIIDAMRRGPGARRERAEQAEQALTVAGHSRESWDRIVDSNAAVATTLAPLGADVARRLRLHGRVLALVQLFVVHGIGDLRALPPASRVPAGTSR